MFNMTLMASNRLMTILFLFVLTTYSCSSDDPNPIIPDSDIVMEDEPENDADSDTDSDDTTSDDTTTDDTTSDDTTSDDTTTTDDDSENDDSSNDSTDSANCTDPSGFVFNEEDGLVLVEFENADFPNNWALKSNGNSHTGEGYMVWEGSQYFSQPGNGTVSFKIKITNPGSYRFMWHSAIKTGNNGTEHNDTWLRFNDADDFYGKKGTSIIYPNGTGKSPNPKGASADGWFKIFRSGNDLDFKWQSRTSDNDAHDVYVKFDNPGIYTMEVSARSSGHAIDKFVLFNNTLSEAEATSSMDQSTISCD